MGWHAIKINQTPPNLVSSEVTIFDGILDAQVYKMHFNFSREKQEKNKALILNVMKFI